MILTPKLTPPISAVHSALNMGQTLLYRFCCTRHPMVRVTIMNRKRIRDVDISNFQTCPLGLHEVHCHQSHWHLRMLLVAKLLSDSREHLNQRASRGNYLEAKIELPFRRKFSNNTYVLLENHSVMSNSTFDETGAQSRQRLIVS